MTRTLCVFSVTLCVTLWVFAFDVVGLWRQSECDVVGLWRHSACDVVVLGVTLHVTLWVFAATLRVTLWVFGVDLRVGMLCPLVFAVSLNLVTKSCCTSGALMCLVS